MTQWAQPISAQHKFTIIADGRDVTARLGFPRPSEKGREWACDFQISGWEDSRIRTAYGVDGAQAFTIAADVLRKSLDGIKHLLTSDEAYELTFPRSVSTAYGLEFHRYLCELLDHEFEKKEREVKRELGSG